MRTLPSLRFGEVIKYAAPNACEKAEKLTDTYALVCRGGGDVAYHYTCSIEPVTADPDVYVALGRDDAQIAATLHNLVNMAGDAAEEEEARTKLSNFLRRRAGEFVVDV